MPITITTKTQGMGGRDENQADICILPHPHFAYDEILWRFPRKEVINTGFYRTKVEFRQAFRDFRDNIGNYRGSSHKSGLLEY